MPLEPTLHYLCVGMPDNRLVPVIAAGGRSPSTVRTVGARS
ncbi:MAG: hypothetical protein J07HX5_01681, partial [halophilic archaeon J07HX5]